MYHALSDDDLSTYYPASGHDAEDSTCSSYAEKALENIQVLPNFFTGSLEEALNAAELELKVLCIVVLSSESDDNSEFKR